MRLLLDVVHSVLDWMYCLKLKLTCLCNLHFFSYSRVHHTDNSKSPSLLIVQVWLSSNIWLLELVSQNEDKTLMIYHQAMYGKNIKVLCVPITHSHRRLMQLKQSKAQVLQWSLVTLKLTKSCKKKKIKHLMVTGLTGYLLDPSVSQNMEITKSRSIFLKSDYAAKKIIFLLQRIIMIFLLHPELNVKLKCIDYLKIL